MSKGLSLHIGLNSVDPHHYQGWSGDLDACELDANDMQLVAKSAHFNTEVLLTKKATRSAVINAISSSAKALGKGDIFFLTYSGHGGQVPDIDGDEDDAQDETWCLYDGELIDDELYHYLGQFKAGVRILTLSDSCHSGSVLRDLLLRASLETQTGPKYKAMPVSVAQRTYLANKDFYDKIGENPAIKNAEESVVASGILISGCQDNQLSSDGQFNGLFTAKLKHAWNGGKFSGDYRKFYKSIVKIMPHDQTPNFFRVGPTNSKFEKQKPFTVSAL